MKTWWGIRHVRWWYTSWRFWHWWYRVGCLLGAMPNPADMDHLDAVWRGDQ